MSPHYSHWFFSSEGEDKRLKTPLNSFLSRQHFSLSEFFLPTRDLTEREMADEQKPDPSLVGLAIQREVAYHEKVATSKDESIKILRRTPSFKDWTDKGSISHTSLQCVSSQKVQSSIELPSPPTSSPRPQNQMGRSLVKNEPWPCSTELSYSRSVTSASKDWIGPRKLPIDKSQTHYSSYEVPPMVPFSSEIPKLHSKNPAIPQPDLVPSRCRNTIEYPNQVQKPILFPKPNIPTRPRSGLKRKARGDEQFLPRRTPSPSTSNDNMIKKSVDNLLCELCQVSCSSALTMQQHVNGRPHKAKLEWMKLKRNSTENRKGKPRCDVCQIWCSDRNALDMHFKGQKHKAKLQELELCKQNGGEKISKKPILCELCLVSCMNEDLFKMHLKGRAHVTREELKSRGLL